MKQHWVPRSYLSPWADPATAGKNPLVWALNVEERRIFHPSVTKIFAETHMYSVTREDGSRDTSLEEGLAKLEGAFAEARDRVELGIEQEPDDEGVFTVYAATMHARSKSMRDHHRGQWQEALDRMDEMEKMIEEKGEAAFSRVVGPSDRHNVMTREDIEHVVGNTAAVIVPIFAKVEAQVFSTMNRAVLLATGDETFITSDRPCAWLDNEPPLRGFLQPSHLMSPGLEVYLPISPRRCFVWSHYSHLAGQIPVGNYYVRMMNLWLASQAAILIRERPLFEKAYCANPRLVRAVVGLFRVSPFSAEETGILNWYVTGINGRND